MLPLINSVIWGNLVYIYLYIFILKMNLQNTLNKRNYLIKTSMNIYQILEKKIFALEEKQKNMWFERLS